MLQLNRSMPHILLIIVLFIICRLRKWFSPLWLALLPTAFFAQRKVQMAKYRYPVDLDLDLIRIEASRSIEPSD